MKRQDRQSGISTRRNPTVALFATRSPAVSRAALWWSADVAGGALFAAALAGWFGAGPDGHARRVLALFALAASGLVRAATQLAAADAGQHAANGAKRSLRARLFPALLPTLFRRARLPGEDLRMATDEVEVADGYVGRFAPIRSASVMAPLACAALAAFASWVSGAIMIVTLIPFAVGMALAGTAAKHQADRQFTALARLTGLFVDRARMLPTIVSFAAEDPVTGEVADAAREVAERTLQVLQVAFLSSAVLEFFAALSVALVAVYCGFSLLHLLPFPAPERLNLGRAFFVLALAPEFYLGMRRLAAGYHDKQQGEAAERSIAPELARAEALTREMARTRSFAGSLEVTALAVTYPDGSSVGPVSAAWPQTGLHAITGATGAGKSSLLHALVGMAPVSGGTIRSGAAEIAPGSLNPDIGWAGQRPFLLPGTLADNLLLGASPGDARWRELVERLGLGALIAARGEGLAIDPAGAGLSGGERRRIGLARAILSDRPVLLLDEPTADLDAASAQAVIACLAEVAKERLVIAATHDPALISRAESEVTVA